MIYMVGTCGVKFSNHRAKASVFIRADRLDMPKKSWYCIYKMQLDPSFGKWHLDDVRVSFST